MVERRRWGRAGERLPAATEEGRRQQARDRQQQHNGNYRRVLGEQEAKRRYEAGLVVPHYITMALDVNGLYGPEVDEACGAAEPDVDRWESGDLYPSWEQLCLLAKLTGYPVAFFTREPNPELVDGLWTTARFHVKAKDLASEPPVWKFTAAAREAMVQGRLW